MSRLKAAFRAVGSSALSEVRDDVLDTCGTSTAFTHRGPRQVLEEMLRDQPAGGNHTAP